MNRVARSYSTAALTGCALAIAETVEKAQIVAGVPEAMMSIAEAIRATGRPVTLVCEPSATSDIELDRVEGVHGPRDLVIFVVS